MSKRLISMLLAIAALLSLAVPALAEGEAQPAEQPAAGPVETVPDDAGPAETETEEAEPTEGQTALMLADEPGSTGIVTTAVTGEWKTLLDNKIAAANTKKSDPDYEATYTEASRKTFEAALDAAVKVQEDEKADNAAGQTAFNDLVNAMEALDDKATQDDIDALDAQIAKAASCLDDANKDKYTSASREALKSAYESALAVKTGEAPKHKAVNEATAELEKKLSELKGNDVTAKIVQAGFIAGADQANDKLSNLVGETVSGCAANTMYAIVSPKAGDDADLHNYRFIVASGENSFAIDTLNFDGGSHCKKIAADKAGMQNYLLITWTPADMGITELAAGTVSCTLNSYNGTYTANVTQESLVNTMNITVDLSYTGPKFLRAGYKIASADANAELSKEGSPVTDCGNDVLYVILDANLKTSSDVGYSFKLIAPDGKAYDLAAYDPGTPANVRKIYWSYNNPSHAKDLGEKLQSGDYTVEMYTLTKKANGTVEMSASAVDTIKITVPTLDMKALNEAIAAAGKLGTIDEKSYVTAAEVKTAVAALDAAKALAAKPAEPQTKAAQDEVDAAASALSTAVEALEPRATGYAALEALIERAKSIVPDSATDPTTFAAVTDALNKAEAVVAQELAESADNNAAIKAAQDALQKAIDGLALKSADKKELAAAIEAAEAALKDTSGYRAAAVKAVQDALAEAKALNDNKDLKADRQEEVNAAVKKLNDAVAALSDNTKANTKALEEAIKKAEALKSSDYEDFSAVQSALAAAKTLLAGEPSESQQDAVDAAVKTLTDAIAALKERVVAEYVYSGGKWVKTSGKWYYQVNGSNETNAWIRYNGKWYYVAPSTGVMATGWAKVDGLWYYFNPGSIKGSPEGAMQKGQLSIKSGKYYLDGSGAMVTGWKKLNGTWYYYTPTDIKGFPEGAMVKSKWILDGNTWYYLNSDGSMRKNGKYTINGRQYYFTSSGAMVTGWKKLSGTWYYFNPGTVKGYPEGAMVKGQWILDGDTWYYLNTDGSMRKNGQYTIRNNQYYFTSSGAMVTGWKKINGVWYYFNPGTVSGYPEGAKIKNAWITVDGTRYYLGSYGNMYTGAKTISGTSFYFESSGAMHTGWRTDGAKKYYYYTVNDDGTTGAMAMNRWVLIGNDWYYFYQDGQMAFNTTIDGYKIGADGTRA